MKWRRFNGELVRSSIEEALEAAILRERKAGHRLKVCIGTDSQERGGKTEFATVIVILREQKGGFMFISSNVTTVPLQLKERLLKEVSMSIDIAYRLCDLLDRHEIDLEVHADINTNPQFKSNPTLKEAMGYILGMGFAFKAKPDAFASTSCANKMV